MSGVRSWGPPAGIATLVVLDVALVYLSVAHVRDGADLPDPGASTASPDTEQDTDDGEETSEPTSDGDGTGKGTESAFESGPVLLDAGTDGTVVRASRGGCDEDTATSVVEVSTDGGESFDAVEVGTSLSDVLRVSASSASDIFVVGADRSCTLAIYSSTDAGSTWTASSGTTGAWHLSPAGGGALHAPAGGRVAPGCDVVALSALSEADARVLCADGQLRGTADGGASWVQLGGLVGAVDIAYENPADGWAVAELDGCPAAVLQTADGGSGWERVACLDAEGEVQAVAVSDDEVTVQVRGEIQHSPDGGQTWSAPGE